MASEFIPQEWIQLFNSSSPKGIAGGLAIEAVSSAGFTKADPQMNPGAGDGNPGVVVIDV